MYDAHNIRHYMAVLDIIFHILWILRPPGGFRDKLGSRGLVDGDKMTMTLM